MTVTIEGKLAPIPLGQHVRFGTRPYPAHLAPQDVEQLREFVDHAAVTPAQELAAHYVRVFDFRNRHSLYLSWWQDGDTRRRGMSLVRCKEVYRAAGLEFTGEELPDFLPAVLEFTARTGDTGLLTEYRDGLEQLRSRLGDFGTPYATVLDAVCATLPPVRTGVRP